MNISGDRQTRNLMVSRDRAHDHTEAMRADREAARHAWLRANAALQDANAALDEALLDETRATQALADVAR
jgi:hypothetical protein